MTSPIDQEQARCATAKAWLDGAYCPPPAPGRASAAPEVTLRVSAHPPADAWVVREVMEPAFEVLRRMSHGRIAVSAYWGESAHPAKEGFLAVADGRTDLAACYTAWEADRHPMAQLLALPNLFPSTATATMVAEQLYTRYLREEFERPGVLMGRLKATGGYQLFCRDEVRTLSDLKGLRIGTNAGIDSRIAAALGAQPVALSSVELRPAFVEGRVDAVSLPDGSSDVFGVGVRARVRLELGVSMTNIEFGLSARAYHAMPTDLQVVLNDWLRCEAQAETQYFYGYGGALARQKFADAGCRFVTLQPADRAELDDRMDALTDRTAAEFDARGLPASRFVASARALVREYAGQDDNALMTEAIRHPLWLMPGHRPA